MIKVLTTHCPTCQVLEKKLKDANIPYFEVTNEDKILSYGVETVPVIVEENGNLISFIEAVQLLNTSEGITRLGGKNSG
jgi:hypothetical protein